MTVPLIILAIYGGILALALAVSSYNGHVNPAEEHVRRVSDAVERAAVAQLLSPAKWILGTSVLLAAGASLLAARRGVPVVWAALVPPVVSVSAMATTFYGARGVHRSLNQAASLKQANASLVHSARGGLSALLLTGGTTFGLTLGLHAWASHELGALPAQFLVLLSSSAIGLVGLILARGAAISALTAHGGTAQLSTAPHGGSLALLVSDSFQAPVLILGAWTSLSALGHATLILLPGTPSATESPFLYPHLLQLLGLVAVGFGALVVRIQEGESSAHGWIRAGLVSMTLLIAGGWSLASQLPSDEARSVPAGLTFFFVSLALAVWAAPRHRFEARRTPHDWRRFWSPLLLVALTLILFATLTTSESAHIRPAEVNRLFVASTVSALPLAILWALCSRFDEVKEQIASLAFSASPPRLSLAEGSMDKLLGLLPVLATFTVLGGIQNQVANLTSVPSLVGLGLGLCLGALLAGTTSSLLKQGCSPFQARLSAAVRPVGWTPGDAALDLEGPSKLCESSIAYRPWLWLALTLAPPFIALLLHKMLAPGGGEWTVWGFCMGLCVFASGHAWSVHHAPDNSERMFGLTSLVTSTAQALLIFIAMGST